jgi:hypothetical protein
MPPNSHREPVAALVAGPPWILGARGAPREAPENTAASFERALELGLDGVAYELRACASGELVLLADAGLDRTSDGSGALALKTLPELADVDAGGWFGARFAGERLMLLEEALELPGNRAGTFPQHLIELREPGLVREVVRLLGLHGRRLSTRVATPRRDTALELRDAGLTPLLIAERSDPELASFLRRERIAACGLTHAIWPEPRSEDWPCERWALGLDAPDQLLAACALPINALTTREPERALAARALAAWAGERPLRWPLSAGALAITPDLALPGGGEWSGSWEVEARLFNPFGWDVDAEVELRVRRGAFETEGLPLRLRLAPGEEVDLPFDLRGGSFSPGGDPLLVAHLRWARGPGRQGEVLSFDVPLERVRSLSLGAEVLRLPLLCERPGDAPASVTVRRRAGLLTVRIENAGGLEDARLCAHLDGLSLEGGKLLRMLLPEDGDLRPGGVPFSVAVVGRERRGRNSWLRARRWAGGLPAEEDAGVPGRLLTRREV